MPSLLGKGFIGGAASVAIVGGLAWVIKRRNENGAIDDAGHGDHGGD